MITRDDYFMGRDLTHPTDMTPDIERNAWRTRTLADALLARFGETRRVNSGWRPPSINANTPGASSTSLHMKGMAIDLEDADGRLDAWCASDFGLAQLKDIGLWLEHPDYTPKWCHLQIIAPGSGNRIFRPR